MPPRSVQHPAGRSSPAAAAAAAATPRPLCHHFLRGCCRYGAACRFSHDVQAASRTSLPFGDRKYVGAEQAAPPPPPPGADSGQRQRPASAPTAGGRHGSWPLRVMSFNVLADCLAREHAAELYTSAPRWSLEWSFRGPRIVKEIVHWRPDVACLQEVDVDCFDELEQALRRSGYAGWFTKRTGDRRDGLALFWLADKLCAGARCRAPAEPAQPLRSDAACPRDCRSSSAAHPVSPPGVEGQRGAAGRVSLAGATRRRGATRQP